MLHRSPLKIGAEEEELIYLKQFQTATKINIFSSFVFQLQVLRRYGVTCMHRVWEISKTHALNVQTKKEENVSAHKVQTNHIAFLV